MRTSISVIIANLVLPLAGCLVCTTVDAGGIFRVNLDGSGPTTLVTGLGFPEGIALDVGGGQMYWTDRSTDKIQRANLDGSAVTNLVTGERSLRGIALDLDAGHIYFLTAYRPIPEPSALALAALGLVGLVIAALRRRD